MTHERRPALAGLLCFCRRKGPPSAGAPATPTWRSLEKAFTLRELASKIHAVLA